MRHLLKSAGVAALGAAAFGLAGAASAETLTVVSWGGAYAKSQIEGTYAQVLSAIENGYDDPTVPGRMPAGTRDAGLGDPWSTSP